jgi:hypothetical protein
MVELKKPLKIEGLENLDAHIGGLGTKRQLRGLFNQGKGVRNNLNRVDYGRLPGDKALAHRSSANVCFPPIPDIGPRVRSKVV